MADEQIDEQIDMGTEQASEGEVKACLLLIHELSEQLKGLSATVHQQVLIVNSSQTELTMLKTGQQETTVQVQLLRDLRTELDIIKENLQQLLKLVRDGNGKPALMTRVAILEDALTTHLGDYRELSRGHKDELTRITVLEDNLGHLRTQAEERKQGQRHRWEIYAAILSGILGMLGGAFALFGK